MKIIPYGEDGVLVNFEQHITPEVNNKVNNLAAILEKHDFIKCLIPAYCSLTITFDPDKTSFTELKKIIEEINLSKNKQQTNGRKLTIPVCYADEFGLDLMALSVELKLSKEAFIEIHTAVAYTVYMIGFLPGFPYLGRTDARITCSRKAQPRKRVEAGSVGLAGNQTGIYPFDSPGGWQLIGRTPLPIFQTRQQEDFLFRAGDEVKFKSISLEAYEGIQQQLAHKTFNWESVYE